MHQLGLWHISFTVEASLLQIELRTKGQHEVGLSKYEVSSTLPTPSTRTAGKNTGTAGNTINGARRRGHWQIQTLQKGKRLPRSFSCHKPAQ